jgi:hydroxyacylglutathione hydrolase
MLLHQRFIPGLAIASYLVGDERSGEAAVIDPTRDVEEYLAFAQDNDLHIRHILETHVHADFVSGARELKARLKAQPVIHSSGMGGAEWTPPYADHVVKDGDEVQVGSMRLKAIHTPMHHEPLLRQLRFQRQKRFVILVRLAILTVAALCLVVLALHK